MTLDKLSVKFSSFPSIVALVPLALVLLVAVQVPNRLRNPSSSSSLLFSLLLFSLLQLSAEAFQFQREKYFLSPHFLPQRRTVSTTKERKKERKKKRERERERESGAAIMRPSRERGKEHVMFSDDADLDADFMEVVDSIDGKHSDKVAHKDFFNDFEDDFNNEF